MTVSTRKMYVGIARDHSSSMGSLRAPAMRDFNRQVDDLIQQANLHGIDVVASVVSFADTVKREVTISSINALKKLTSYPTSGWTALYDAINDLHTQFSAMPDFNNEDVQVVIFAITDGEENASSIKATELRAKLQKFHATGRGTVVIRVPNGHRSSIAYSLGIPEGNIDEWDQNERSLNESSAKTSAGVAKMFSDAKAGIKSTTGFYTDLSNVTAKDVKAVAKDISGEVSLWTVKNATEGNTIRGFCELKSGKPFLKGGAYYQLMKPESEVQDYKQIALRDKTTGHVYAGDGVRALLGLPAHGTVKVVPGDHGNYDIFIQSTSVNRKLPVGTTVLYRTSTGVAYKEGASAPKTNLPTPVQATAPATSKATASPYAAVKPAPAPKPVVPAKTAVAQGRRLDVYTMGYKDGRGKKKNRKADFSALETTIYQEGFADGKAKKPSKY